MKLYNAWYCPFAWQRYHQWYEAMLALPAFKATAFDHDDYERRLIEHYLPYSVSEG